MTNKKYYIVLLLLFIVSCKIDSQESEEKDDSIVKGNEPLKLSENRSLNNDEAKYATKICQALGDHADYLSRAIGLKFKYQFELSGESCTSALPISSHAVYFMTPADSSAKLRYKSQSGSDINNFSYDILTNESTYLKNLCDSFLAGDLERPKLIQKIGNEYVKFRFLSASGFEFYVYKNRKGKWISQQFEGYEINIKSNDERYGMVKQRVAGSFCANGKQAFYRQKLK